MVLFNKFLIDGTVMEATKEVMIGIIVLMLPFIVLIGLLVWAAHPRRKRVIYKVYGHFRGFYSHPNMSNLYKWLKLSEKPSNGSYERHSATSNSTHGYYELKQRPQVINIIDTSKYDSIEEFWADSSDIRPDIRTRS